MSESGRATSWFGREPGATPAGWHLARRVVTAVWLGGIGVQLIIWALMSLIGWRFVNPYWLWTAAVGGVVVGALWWITGHRTRGAAAKGRRS